MNYQNLIEIYNRRFTTQFSGETYKRAVERDVEIVRYCNQSITNPKICDVGCGRGIHLLRMAEETGWHVLGIDFSRSAEKDFLIRHSGRSGCHFILSSIEEFALSTTEKFDVVTCYFPHLDSRHQAHTISFLGAIETICAPRGKFILSSFCAELAPSLVSNVSVSYCKTKDDRLHSDTQYDPKCRLLTITQRHNEWPEPLIEEMQLYTDRELRSMLSKVGFSSIQSLPELGFQQISDLQRLEESKITLIAQK